MKLTNENIAVTVREFPEILDDSRLSEVFDFLVDEFKIDGVEYDRETGLHTVTANGEEVGFEAHEEAFLYLWELCNEEEKTDVIMTLERESETLPTLEDRRHARNMDAELILSTAFSKVEL